MIKIAKFGGSSVASAEQFKKVKAIVEADPDRRFIVSSAAGKRHSTDNKITDLLLLVNAQSEPRCLQVKTCSQRDTQCERLPAAEDQ